jgi:ABC-type maltose transport system permease subunit
MADILIQMVPTLVWTVLIAIPLYVIIPRTGKSRWLLLVALVPMLGAIGLLWYLAFSRWSREASRDASVFS